MLLVKLGGLEDWVQEEDDEPHRLCGPTLEIAGTWLILEAHEVEVFEDGSMQLMDQTGDLTDQILRAFEGEIASAVETVEHRGKRWVIWAKPHPAMSESEWEVARKGWRSWKESAAGFASMVKLDKWELGWVISGLHVLHPSRKEWSRWRNLLQKLKQMKGEEAARE